MIRVMLQPLRNMSGKNEGRRKNNTKHRRTILSYSNFDIPQTINQEKNILYIICIYIYTLLITIYCLHFPCVMRIKKMALISKLPLYWLTFGWLVIILSLSLATLVMLLQPDIVWCYSYSCTECCSFNIVKNH